MSWSHKIKQNLYKYGGNMGKKYKISIDVQDYSVDGPIWRNYGTLEASGDSLEELFEDATVDIKDQDGGEVAVVHADSPWMQALIEAEIELKYGGGQ